MMKKRKYKFNSDKAFNNFVVLTSIVVIGYLIYKVATCGIAWISTIGYFR